MKMTEVMNEIIHEADKWDNYRKITFMEHAAKLFQAIFFLCRMYMLEPPTEAMSAKDLLDDYFKEDVFHMTFSDDI